MSPSIPSEPASAFRGRRVLVLGATGFIGRWLARYLARGDVDLHVAGRDPVALDRLAASGVRGREWTTDLFRPGSAAALVASAAPDVVFNAAGYGIVAAERDVDRLRRLNADLPGEIVGALANVPSDWDGARLLHVGSGAEYGRLEGSLPETGPAEPVDEYGRTKLAGTRAVLEGSSRLGVPAVVARPFSVYGPGEHPGRLVPSLLDAHAAGTHLDLGAGTARRDFAYVEDVVVALLALAAVAPCPGGVVNVCTGRLESVREFVEAGAAALGMDPAGLRFGVHPAGRFDFGYGPVTNARLRELTGLVPATRAGDGVVRTWRWRAGE